MSACGEGTPRQCRSRSKLHCHFDRSRSSAGSLRKAACWFGFVTHSGTGTFCSLCELLVPTVASTFLGSFTLASGGGDLPLPSLALVNQLAQSHVPPPAASQSALKSTGASTRGGDLLLPSPVLVNHLAADDGRGGGCFSRKVVKSILLPFLAADDGRGGGCFSGPAAACWWLRRLAVGHRPPLEHMFEPPCSRTMEHRPEPS